MIKLKSVQSSLFVTVNFERPLLDWQGVPARFFEMILDSLSGLIPISPREFSITPGSTLGDFAAKYNIYGRNSSIALFANNIAIEFPTLLPEEYQFALNVMHAVDISFLEAFPECDYDSIQSQSYEHAEIVEGETATSYLARFGRPLALDGLAGDAAIYQHMGRFVATATDAGWQALCGVEKSAHGSVSDGLFLLFDISLKNVRRGDSFESKLTRAQQAVTMGMTALELEWADGS